MSKVIAETKPRYMVETANTISNYGGGRIQGAWNFAYAYDDLSDAEAMAARMAMETEFVRIVDREADDA